MQLTIHRGARQIGGNCVEVACGATQLIIDVGLPLELAPAPSRDSKTRMADPIVKSLFAKEPPVAAVLLSHAHLDHSGLLDHVPAGTQVWMSRGTSKILQAGAVYARHPRILRGQQFILEPRIPYPVGGLKVTGYPVDHSVYGAMAFLIEGDQRRLLYTGDLRLHGRKPGMARNLVADLGGTIDALLIEGTHIPADHVRGPSEATLARQIAADVRAAPGLVLACFAPANLDRFAAFFKAAIHAGRLLAIDHYMAFILHMVAAAVKSIPSPASPQVRIFGPQRQTRIDKVARKYVHNEIPLAEILRNPQRYVMLFRPSMLTHDFNNALPSGVLCIHSYWSGYLSRPEFLAVHAAVDLAEGRFIERHTSGHLYRGDITRLISDLHPKMVVPIHTEVPAAFSNLYSQTIVATDGKEINL